MNPVIHFEMPAEDRKRMSDFYSKTFGWQTQILGEEMGGYVLANTIESDQNGRPAKVGGINGILVTTTSSNIIEYPEDVPTKAILEAAVPPVSVRV